MGSVAACTERCFHGPPRGLAQRTQRPGQIVLGRREASEAPAPAAAVIPAFGHSRYLAQFIRVRVQTSSSKLNPHLNELHVGEGF